MTVPSGNVDADKKSEVERLVSSLKADVDELAKAIRDLVIVSSGKDLPLETAMAIENLKRRLG